MSSSIIPEKFAMYFATMNSLSSKIYSDIQAVEESVKFPQNLTYSEKCAILDKHLIHDVVKNKKPVRGAGSAMHSHSEDIKEPVYYDDPVLDQDQISALLLTVCPRKPEKYIYDDNSFWIDEHSVPYSCCTQSQANICKLGEFVKALPTPLLTHHKSTGAVKSKHIPENNKQNYRSGRKQSVESGSQSEEESDFDSCPETDTENDTPKKEMNKIQVNQTKPPTRMAFMGVPVMGFMGSSAPPKKTAANQEKHEKNGDEESNLPQQKQNSDLIAELQAKLKMNKANAKGSAPCKPQTQKVSKPKAPPPPPPKVPIPGMAVKITAPVAPEKTEKKTEATIKPKLQKSVQATTSIQKTNEKDKKSKISKEKSTEEFVVDISSPCKIVTPKTGFDFLDNW